VLEGFELERLGGGGRSLQLISTGTQLGHGSGGGKSDLPIAVLASREAMTVVLLPIEKLKLDVARRSFGAPVSHYANLKVASVEPRKNLGRIAEEI
jgi:hypothetical protein